MQDFGLVLVVVHGHHSLVTPIDWKLDPVCVYVSIFYSHHSLVTPIDWKLIRLCLLSGGFNKRHHSLVTPIDWKPVASVQAVALVLESPLVGDTY